MISLTIENGNLILRTPYDAGLVQDLKASIPLHGRAWNPKRKVWEVAYMYGQDVVDVVRCNLGTELAIPKQHTSVKLKTDARLLKIEYIGAVKERENGDMLAMGYCDNSWSVVLSLKVLREWFEGNGDEPIKPEDAPSRYAILGVKRKADSKEIKRAYRIAAKTWHPDVNDEDTTGQFRLIQDAYEVLSDDKQRKKYDAALYFEAQAGKKETDSIDDLFTANKYGLYKPPKRCGWLTVQGQEMLGRFVVDRILRWDDIMNGDLTMVSYWGKGDDKFSVDWV